MGRIILIKYCRKVCFERLNQPCLIWYVGCIIIGLCLSICVIVNYDRLAAWAPHCNGFWLIEAETSELCTPTRVQESTCTNAHTHFVVHRKHESVTNSCTDTQTHTSSLCVDLLPAAPLHTHFLCEEHLTPELIESQIKCSFWLWFTQESWPRRFNYSISISAQAHRHFINSIVDAMTESIWARVIEVKEENEQRWREKHIKEGSEIKRWKGRNEASTGVLSQGHLKKTAAYQIPLFPPQHLQCCISSV